MIIDTPLGRIEYDKDKRELILNRMSILAEDIDEDEVPESIVSYLDILNQEISEFIHYYSQTNRVMYGSDLNLFN